MYKRPHWTGNESLMLDGKALPYTMIDYWRLNLSDLLLDFNRGGFAEFIVQCAMARHGSDALSQEMNGTEPFDIEGPVIKTTNGTRKSRIEVKSTASVHLHTPDDLEPIRRKKRNTLRPFCVERME